jgi:hypothetical protein
LDLSLPDGWQSFLLEVPRRQPGGRREPGILYLAVAVPPKLADIALGCMGAGRQVAVVGMLDVELEHAEPGPDARHAVIAESMEPLS